MDAIDAWHFLPHDRRLRKPLPDGTRPVITPGWSYRTGRTIEMFWRRLEAHERAIDALCYGAGPTVCRVRLGGTIYRTPYLQRLVATEFKVLWMVDAADLFEDFGLMVAERTLLRERLAGREPLLGYWEWLRLRQRLLAGEKVLWYHPAHPPPNQFLGAMMRETQQDRPQAAGTQRYRMWPHNEWSEMWRRAREEWDEVYATLPGAVAATANAAGYKQSRQGAASGLRVVLQQAATAARLSRAAWSEVNEVAAVAAGLAVQPDELNAELEKLLLAAKPDDALPA